MKGLLVLITRKKRLMLNSRRKLKSSIKYTMSATLGEGCQLWGPSFQFLGWGPTIMGTIFRGEGGFGKNYKTRPCIYKKKKKRKKKEVICLENVLTNVLEAGHIATNKLSLLYSLNHNHHEGADGGPGQIWTIRA